MVHYFYRTIMWRHHAHISMVPLTKLTKIEQSKFKQNWGPADQDTTLPCFDAIKAALISQDVLLRYLDPNLPFDIETDASDSQLVGTIVVVVVKQASQPLAFFRSKLTAASQGKYSLYHRKRASFNPLKVLEAFRVLLSWCMLLVLLEDVKPEGFYKPGPRKTMSKPTSLVATLFCHHGWSSTNT
jgi:hypothetical protein